jgi:hypothetical protein
MKKMLIKNDDLSLCLFGLSFKKEKKNLGITHFIENRSVENT